MLITFFWLAGVGWERWEEERVGAWGVGVVFVVFLVWWCGGGGRMWLGERRGEGGGGRVGRGEGGGLERCVGGVR